MYELGKVIKDPLDEETGFGWSRKGSQKDSDASVTCFFFTICEASETSIAARIDVAQYI